MNLKQKLSGRTIKPLSLVLTLALVVGVVAFASPAPASAHCDSVNGPVVGAAQAALNKGDVKLILPYVQPDAEAELTAAFNQALKVGKQGGDAKKLAETYFFETAVRLHRLGEGATYTGLNYTTDFGPGLEAADKALQTSSIAEVNKLLQKALADGVAAKFETVKTARQKAAREGTLEAQRERAEAELIFEKYVFELYTAITAASPHSEGAVPRPRLLPTRTNKQNHTMGQAEGGHSAFRLSRSFPVPGLLDYYR